MEINSVLLRGGFTRNRHSQDIYRFTICGIPQFIQIEILLLRFITLSFYLSIKISVPVPELTLNILKGVYKKYVRYFKCENFCNNVVYFLKNKIIIYAVLCFNLSWIMLNDSRSHIKNMDYVSLTRLVPPQSSVTDNDLSKLSFQTR